MLKIRLLILLGALGLFTAGGMPLCAAEVVSADQNETEEISPASDGEEETDGELKENTEMKEDTELKDSMQPEEGADVIRTRTARYLGVYRYGDPDVNREHFEDFRYRFLEDGEEKLFSIDPGPAKDDGSFEYPVQNVLKENHVYQLTMQGETVLTADELQEGASDTPAWVPGKRTVRNFLAAALQPVGTTLYIYGGGWNWQDDAASISAKSIGISEDWVRFFTEQDEEFTYRDRDGDPEQKNPAESYYPYGEYNEYYYAGLDCSGYVGWAVYNTLHDRDAKMYEEKLHTLEKEGRADEMPEEELQAVNGYVTGASGYAHFMEKLGYGTVSAGTGGVLSAADLHPGDIVSISGHVWICLGSCADGSILIAHATPTTSRAGQPGGGVQVSAVGTSKECDAWKLADQYMSEKCPQWYARYEAVAKDPAVYLDMSEEPYGVFTWTALTDPEGIREMSAEQVLACLWG